MQSTPQKLGNLVLRRKLGESIRIGDSITVKVAELGGGYVKLAIHAPPLVNIVRTELLK